MDDLFTRKKRRSPLLLAGAGLFALLALISFVEAMRDPPLIFSGFEVASAAERVAYRVGAGSLSLLLAVAIFPRVDPPELRE